MLRPGVKEVWVDCRKLFARLGHRSNSGTNLIEVNGMLWQVEVSCSAQTRLLSGKETQEVENDRTSSLKILFYLLLCHCVILTDYRWFCYKELRHLGDHPTCAKLSLYLDSFFSYITSFLIPVWTERVDTKKLLFKTWRITPTVLRWNWIVSSRKGQKVEHFSKTLRHQLSIS